MDDRQLQQAILARDIIDMAREYADDADALEYISSMCFTLFRIFEKDSMIDWHMIFSVYDQKYYQLKKEGTASVDEAPVDNIFQIATDFISHTK